MNVAAELTKARDEEQRIKYEIGLKQDIFVCGEILMSHLILASAIAVD